MTGADLDDAGEVVGGQAVAEDAFDEEADDLEVDEELKALGKVDARQTDQLGL